MKSQKIEKGAFVLVSRGEYSDYEVTLLARATREIDPTALMDEFAATLPKEELGEFQTDLDKFAAWLTREGGPLEELPKTEFFIGAYSTLANRM